MALSPVNYFKHCWQLLRQATGDDAYERYRAHYVSFHGEGCLEGGARPEGPFSGKTPPADVPLTRQQFFRRRQEEKWSKVSRCC